VPKLGGGKEGSKTTQYERRFGDDRRSSRRSLLRPWFDFGRDLGCVCDVYRSEIKTIKEREHMKSRDYVLHYIQTFNGKDLGISSFWRCFADNYEHALEQLKDEVERSQGERVILAEYYK
jgi:hypothetical protein